MSVEGYREGDMQSRARILPPPFPAASFPKFTQNSWIISTSVDQAGTVVQALDCAIFPPPQHTFPPKKREAVRGCKTHSQLEESQGSNPGLWIPELSPLLCVVSAFEAGKKWRFEGLLAKKADSSTQGQCLSDSSSLSLP